MTIARFWASAATYNPQHERYEIHGVVGPDEYHTAEPGAEEPGLPNNSYTNLMAAWTLCRAPELLKHLPPERFTALAHLGVRFAPDGVHINPVLPHELRRVELCVHYHGGQLGVAATADTLELRAAETNLVAIPVFVQGEQALVEPGRSVHFAT